MAVIVSGQCPKGPVFMPENPNHFNCVRFLLKFNRPDLKFPHPSLRTKRLRCLFPNESSSNSEGDTPRESDGEANDLGVKAALAMLRFYKREISPVIPRSCRYVPTCSEYSMEAYRKYGVLKGTILTAWRLCRCNPLGGSGFDPPRWFGETRPPEEEGDEDYDDDDDDDQGANKQ